MTQGQGPLTAIKEHTFLGLLRMNCSVGAKRPSSVYVHFDLNAGCGFNHQVDCEGSPLVFLRAATVEGLTNFRAHFVERNPVAVKELLQRIADPRCCIHHGDNREFIYAIPELVQLAGGDPRRTLGSLIFDPNGPELWCEELAWLGQQCPKIDFILNYSARQWKRVRGAGIKDGVFLREQLQAFCKQHWHIQEPLPDDRQEWMVLIGRNYLMRDWKSARLHELNSAKGQEILDHTVSRREMTYSLFELRGVS